MGHLAQGGKRRAPIPGAARPLSPYGELSPRPSRHLLLLHLCQCCPSPTSVLSRLDGCSGPLGLPVGSTLALHRLCVKHCDPLPTPQLPAVAPRGLGTKRHPYRGPVSTLCPQPPICFLSLRIGLFCIHGIIRYVVFCVGLLSLSLTFSSSSICSVCPHSVSFNGRIVPHWVAPGHSVCLPIIRWRTLGFFVPSPVV